MLVCSVGGQAATAPDPTRPGPYRIGSGSYALPAKFDRELSGEFKTQLAAAIWYPKNAPVSEPRPVLVFLSGNHATCGYFDRKLKIRVDDDTTYTYSGTCPKGYVEAKSHLGFTYLAERLAAWGYVVVSIDANRGVNAAPEPDDDSYLIQARGRLILRHLELLGKWARSGGTPRSVGLDLRGRLDFANVGLMGHSRGGDAIVAAYAMALDNRLPWRRRLPMDTAFRGLFAIAPTDAQERPYYPINTAYAVLLPMCDGDVSDLEGLHFFERALRATREYPQRIKAMFAVWGTNHNYYNSEWQESDATGCVGHQALFDLSGGSAAQRESAIHPIMGFFRATVGRHANPVFARLLDSTFRPAAPLRERFTIERAWSISPDKSLSFPLETFAQTRLRSSAGIAYGLTRIKAASIEIPDHNKQGLALAWRGATPAKPSQLAVTVAGKGRSIDLAGWASIEIRMAMGCGGELAYPDCYTDPPVRDGVALQGEIRLIDANGRRSKPVSIEDYARLVSPVGVDYEGYYFIRHPVMSMLRIPSFAFDGIDRTAVNMIEFSFGRTAKAVVYLGDVRLSRAKASFPSGLGQGAPTLTVAQATTATTSTRPVAAPGRSRLASGVDPDESAMFIRRGPGPDATGRALPEIEFVATSQRAFPVTADGMKLRVGDVTLRGGSFEKAGRTDQIVFHVSDRQLSALPDGAPVMLFGLASQKPWSLGNLNKADIR